MTAVLALSAFAECAPAAENPASTAIADANNRFAFDLYRQLRHQRGNLFFSPFSISTALAMVHTGARGITAEEIASTIHLTDVEEIASTMHLADDETLATYADLLADLTGQSDSTTCRLEIASRLWGRSGAHILDSYRTVMRDQYLAEMKTVNFEDAAGARARINEWVSERTSGKIEEIIAPGTIGPLTRLMLTNTIYFRGAWTKPFPEAATVETVFKRSSSTEVRVPTMRRTSEFAFAKVEGLSLIELPYKGDRLAMVILLPDSTDGLPALEARLSSARLDSCLASLRPTLVELLLPRFSTREVYDLIPLLNALGMRSAFVARVADFSGIDGGRDSLHIDHVAQGAYMNVDEQGTEAAAATLETLRTLGFTRKETQPKVFWVDHPFVFLIRDRLTGAILFLGRVVDPSAV